MFSVQRYIHTGCTTHTPRKCYQIDLLVVHNRIMEDLLPTENNLGEQQFDSGNFILIETVQDIN